MSRHLLAKPVLASIYRNRYCESGGAGCARYLLACSGPLAIPDDMLPNQHHRLAAYGVPVDRPDPEASSADASCRVEPAAGASRHATRLRL